MRIVFWSSLLMLGALLGFGITQVSQPNTPTPQIICRPSQPEQVPHEAAVLFWGNSLAFDHGWEIDGYLTVNCARQGMTALDALAVTDMLPRMSFRAIVLVFGTVEMMREDKTRDAFSASVQQIVEKVKGLYPAAQIFVLGVPGDRELQTAWAYESGPSLDEVNQTLRTLEGTLFLDLTEILSGIPQNEVTYDGVHLSQASYQIIETLLARAADAP